jgi:hypothetical protein
MLSLFDFTWATCSGAITSSLVPVLLDTTPGKKYEHGSPVAGLIVFIALCVFIASWIFWRVLQCLFGQKIQNWLQHHDRQRKNDVEI